MMTLEESRKALEAQFARLPGMNAESARVAAQGRPAVGYRPRSPAERERQERHELLSEIKRNHEARELHIQELYARGRNEAPTPPAPELVQLQESGALVDLSEAEQRMAAGFIRMGLPSDAAVAAARGRRP